MNLPLISTTISRTNLLRSTPDATWTWLIVLSCLTIGVVFGIVMVLLYQGLQRRARRFARGLLSGHVASLATPEDSPAREVKLQSLLSSMRDLVFVVDHNLVFQDYHQPASESLFLPPEQFVGRRIDAVGFPPATLTRLMNALQKTRDSYTPSRVEYALDLPTGCHWFDACITAMPQGDTSPPWLTCVVRDITRLKNAEMQLAVEHRVLQSILATTPGFLVFKDLDGVYREANPAFCRFLGRDREDVVGKTDHQLFPSDEANTYVAGDCEVIGTGRTQSGDWLVSGADGQRWLQVHKSPVRNEAGDCMGVLCSTSDVTDRKAVEERLRASEVKHRRLVEHAIAGIALHDIVLDEAGNPVDYIFTDANPAFETHTGLRIKDVIGRRATEVLPGIELEPFIRIYGEVVRTKRPVSMEQYCVALGRHYSISAYPVNDGQFGVVFADITDRKLAEERLQTSEENFRLCFESMADMMVVIAPSGQMVYANRSLLERLGYAERELLQLHVLDLHPPETHTEAQEIFAAMLRGERNHCPLPLIARDRSVIPVEMRVWRGTWNGAGCLFAIIKDLSKEAEAQQRFERLFRNNPVALALTDMHEEKFIDVNDAFLKTLGYSQSEIIGKTASDLDLFPRPEPREAAADMLRRTGHLSSTEIQVRRKDGRLLFGLFSGDVIKSQGSECFLTAMVNITDQKRVEHDLKESVSALESANRALALLNDAAESATHAKSAFLANMSHEIRTPMTAILGFCELLLNEMGADREPPVRIDALHTIQRNGQYLLELINDILDLSKVEAGKLEVQRTPCSPAQVLRDVVSLMNVRAEAKQLPLSLEYRGGVPERIYSDPLRLRQILVNLVGNAVKFTERGGVRLVAGLVHGAGGKTLLQVDVIDTGIGLTSEQMSQLFQPFSQVDSSPARAFGGTGLGLTISRRLSTLLGGDITIQSEPGTGSTFTVTVETGPLTGVRILRSPEEGPLPAASKASRPAAGATRIDGRILLAEDGPDNQRLISFMLRKAGAEVSVAENGKLALEKAVAARQQGEPFDLILMDMQMPVMDGYESTRRLRAEGYTGPIVALTANAMEGDDCRCRAAGCNDYLTKPIDHARFLGTIERWTRPSPATIPPITPIPTTTDWHSCSQP